MPDIDAQHDDVGVSDFVNDAKVSAPGGVARVVRRRQLLSDPAWILRQRSVDELVTSSRNDLRQLFGECSSRALDA